MHGQISRTMVHAIVVAVGAVAGVFVASQILLGNSEPPTTTLQIGLTAGLIAAVMSVTVEYMRRIV